MLIFVLLTWTDDLGDGDVPLPRGGDAALGQTQLGTVITWHLEIGLSCKS